MIKVVFTSYSLMITILFFWIWLRLGWQHISDGADFPLVVLVNQDKRTPHFSYSAILIFDLITGVSNSTCSRDQTNFFYNQYSCARIIL